MKPQPGAAELRGWRAAGLPSAVFREVEVKLGKLKAELGYGPRPTLLPRGEQAERPWEAMNLPDLGHFGQIRCIAPSPASSLR